VRLSANLYAYRWLTGRPCPLCGMTRDFLWTACPVAFAVYGVLRLMAWQ
jgi:disulfide bond formation protein DsbB